MSTFFIVKCQHILPTLRNSAHTQAKWLVIAEELAIKIVAKYADGHLLTATESLDLNSAIEVTDEFLAGTRGWRKIATLALRYP